MKVKINDRNYELKELTKEEAKAYIGEEVYVWDSATHNVAKRKLLEVFEPSCDYPFCVLNDGGVSICVYNHCAPVPEEWYVYKMEDGHYFTTNHEEVIDGKLLVGYVDHGSEEYCAQKVKELCEQKEWYVIDLGKVVKGKRYHTTTTPSNFGVADHGSEEYCKQKARELNDKEMPCCECTHAYEPMIVCSGCDNKSKFERKETREETREASAEHPLTYYELSHLLKCFGVDLYDAKEVFINNTIVGYVATDVNKALPDGYKIRYKCGEWMPITRETVWKWWGEEVPNSDIARFVSFMEWDV